ncbi:hypothetical protein [Iningainema tapete]|uniref:Uncharacterized protein n=1 Tax=Iningainema tapete BLCC-T55 TaxID=2748662 RepID=A0A8J6XSA1_9CYAN|nr:hypothetical protein [Iningainema tapete]MBD2778286.1 hypothetical protein [Iningainema tapete BLCC-T55]
MLGIIEPYKDGFVEVVPEGKGSDYWQIAAIHIKGEVFCPNPRLFRNELSALGKAQQIYDWIASHEQETRSRICYCEELKLPLWRHTNS